MTHTSSLEKLDLQNQYQSVDDLQQTKSSNRFRITRGTKNQFGVNKNYEHDDFKMNTQQIFEMLKKETKHVKNKFYESNKLSARMSEDIRLFSNIRPTKEAPEKEV